ncbi:hypothetical protein Acr_14g0004630 [Actinidia rufa]|uniref:Uncharacterized protein n=1 Tax=Actinidia rufa TaxID=165716 RepID=A0A7J0FSA7_9ERIC|nr:hypothetical protein Acr_14g0004630 [Actinidia rufa]
MVDVRNHKTRAFPYCALLTKVFNYFAINLRGQQNQGINKGFSMNTIKKGIDFDFSEEERGVEMEYENIQDFESARAMDVERNLDIIPIQVNLNQGDDEGYRMERVNEDIHAGVNMEKEYAMHGAYPAQEGTSHQGGTPAWVVDLQASLGKIKQQQAEIIQTQKRHEEQLDHLGDFFYGLKQQGQQVERIGNLYETMYEENVWQFSNIHANLEGLWNVLGPHPPPPPPFAPGKGPPRPPNYHGSPY